VVFCLFQGEVNNQDTIGFLVFYQRTPEKMSATIQNRWSIRMNNHYPLVNIQKAIENGHRNSGFTHQKWRFSIVMLNYQTVTSLYWWLFSKPNDGAIP